MNTQEKIIKILENLGNKYLGYGLSEGQINLIVSEIAPMIDKRNKIIEAQEELINYTFIRTNNPPQSSEEYLQTIKELRQKIEQLKSEIK